MARGEHVGERAAAPQAAASAAAEPVVASAEARRASLEKRALVVLAAGAGRRLGGVAKALLRIPRQGEGAASESYLARICATAAGVGVVRGVVVVGPPFAAEVAAEARRLGLDVVENPHPERGMASSIELGFAWAEASTAAQALLWPCDHPAVTVATLRELIGEAVFASLKSTIDAMNEVAPALVEEVPAAIIPTVAGRGGHPALISRSLFAALARCADAPEGARSVLRAAVTRRVELADRGCIDDVDEPADVAALEASR